MLRIRTKAPGWFVAATDRFFPVCPVWKQNEEELDPWWQSGKKMELCPRKLKFVISRLVDRAKLATRSRILNKRGITWTSRPLECNLISNTISPNLCQVFRLLFRLLFRLGKREKTVRSCNELSRPAAATPATVLVTSRPVPSSAPSLCHKRCYRGIGNRTGNFVNGDFFEFQGNFKTFLIKKRL